MADKKKILIADDFQLLREDLTELINNQRDMEGVGTASLPAAAKSCAGNCFFRKRDCESCQKHRI